MSDCSVDAAVLPLSETKDVLSGILREGAQRLLAQAVEAEVANWIDTHAQIRDQAGHRQVVRNGHLPSRTILTGVQQIFHELANLGTIVKLDRDPIAQRRGRAG